MPSEIVVQTHGSPPRNSLMPRTETGTGGDYDAATSTPRTMSHPKFRPVPALKVTIVNPAQKALQESVAAMIRSARIALLVAIGVGFAALPAQARKKVDPDASKLAHASDTKKDTSAGKPVQVGTFGDWGAYLAKGKSKTCYALASPKERKPDVKHDAAYVFIADRPAEKVHNEVSIIMGFPVKETGVAQAKVGRAAFDLVAKGANAWIKNPDEEAKFVEALQHSATLIVKAAPMKGPTTIDSYALDGLKQALARVTKDCK